MNEINECIKEICIYLGCIKESLLEISSYIEEDVEEDDEEDEDDSD